MKEFNINVRVQIGITDALLGLLSAFAKSAPAAIPAAPVPDPEPVKTEVAPEAVEVAPVEKPAQQAEAPAPVVKAASEAAQEPEKELTEVDVRAAMDRTRRRIEGENYKEDTGSEGYKKWHRALTGWFKSTAAIYGADKPSALPDHASRKGFIEECDQVHVENGQLVITPPF